MFCLCPLLKSSKSSNLYLNYRSNHQEENVCLKIKKSILIPFSLFRASSLSSPNTFSLIMFLPSSGRLNATATACYSSLSYFTIKPVLSGHSNRRPKIGFQDRLSLNAGQKYCRMLQESILQYFRPSLSYHLSLIPLLCLFLMTA